MQSENLDAVKDRVLTENTAQSVLKNLQNLRSNQAHFRERWIWELLQNARDAKAEDVSVRYDEDKVVFRHDGIDFTSEEITHLIYHGSTKIEDAGTIGQYGSGFLTTHLLSPEIEVSGGFGDRERFRFRLGRRLGSVSDLTDSMNRAWEDFRASRAPASGSGDSGTEFIYPLNSDVDAIKAVESGIAMLKRCAPLAVVFNDKFSSIKIESRSETTAFRAIRRSQLEKERGLHDVVVAETENGIRREHRYIVALGESAQVAIPLEWNGGDTVCAPIREIPKLFLGFPLIGTADFGFPAVINSLKFAPTEFRDGVFIRRGNNEANRQNEKIIEEACGLLVNLIDFAAKSGWRNIHELARVPHTVNYTWLDEDWLKGRVKDLFVEKIREKAIALNGAGERIRPNGPNALKLPFADTDEGALTLWDLLADWKGREKALPRRDEAVGWRDAVKSWAAVSNRDVSSYREIMDGDKLAKTVHNASRALTHHMSRIGLKEGVDPIGWLNRLIGFLIDSGSKDSLHRHKIVPSQSGSLHTLPRFRRDTGIDKELKDIAHLANEWRIRPKLRDVRVTSLSDEIGAGDWGNADVVRLLIGNLKARAEKNPDRICFEASARLFAWIVGQKDWSALRDLPIFSAEYESANRRPTRDILKLDNSRRQVDLPLAPVASWEEGLKPYSELFPMRHTLADSYFDAVRDSETWDTLDQMGFVRKSVIVKAEAELTRFRADDLPDENDHRTSGLVPVTDVAFMTSPDVGIMARVRQSRSRAGLFWRFVTEWLIHKDPDGLEVRQASCVCDKEHRYYPAEWIAPLRENKWIPKEGTRIARQANAQNLADLLRCSEWTLASLADNPAAVKILEAIGITQFDLTRHFMAATDEERAEQEKEFTKILISSDGDLGPVREFVEKRRERSLTARRNQHLGAQVEDLVRQSLESEGFIVKRTGTGSDFQIQPDDAARLDDDERLDDAASLKLERDGKSWLIEVKATRDYRVRMSNRQAITAVEERDGFLLCVVPIGRVKPDPELEDVRASMRFVSDIGARLHEPMQRLSRDFRVSAGEVAAYYSDGVQLEVESGTPRVRVANTVWENDGFPLDDLRGKLT